MSCKENCNCSLFHKETIELVENKIKTDEEYTKISEVFKILSDFTRVKLLEAISEHELCVCDLGHILGITKSAVSHQMKFLKAYDLVNSNRVGKMVYYKIRDENIIKLISNAYNHTKVQNEKND